jgi:hypothetical protein
MTVLKVPLFPQKDLFRPYGIPNPILPAAA